MEGLLGAAVCTAITLFATVMAVVGFINDFGQIGAGLQAVGVLIAGMAIVAVAVQVRRRVTAARTAARTITLRSEGHDLHETALHEAGHVVMGRKRGWMVRRVTINPDGTGLTEMVLPPWAEYSVLDDAAIDYAGAAACGSLRGCDADYRHAADVIRGGVRWSGRGSTDRHARRTARNVVGHGVLWPKSEVARVARGLPAPGTRRFSR